MFFADIILAYVIAGKQRSIRIKQEILSYNITIFTQQKQFIDIK
jgi:hypothetical protein